MWRMWEVGNQLKADRTQPKQKINEKELNKIKTDNLAQNSVKAVYGGKDCIQHWQAAVS